MNPDLSVDVKQCAYCAKYYLKEHEWHCNMDMYDYHVCKHCFTGKNLKSFGYHICNCSNQ
jgi:hypothetical protein